MSAQAVSSSKPETVGVRRGLILAVVCAAAFMGVLDIAIVNVALPSIRRDLEVAQSSLQWVVVAYGLMFGGFLLLGGRLSDLLGRRRVFVTGLVVFGLSSLASGLAPSLGVLVISRGLQGLGAALTAPSALSILTNTFPEGAERNRALGVWGAVAGTGATAGVIAGGALTSGPGWPWIFFINVPIGLGLAVAAMRIVPRSNRRVSEGRFDALGATVGTGGLLLFVYGVNQTIGHGWLSFSTVIPLVAAAALIASFVIIERRSAAPLVPFGVFRRPTLTAANILAALLFGSFAPLIFLTTLYMQQVLGYSALRAGVSFLAMSVSSLLASAIVGQWLVGRLGVRRTLVFGFSLLTVGLALMARASVDGNYADMLPTFLMAGIGLGSSVVPAQVAAFAGTAEHEAGLASGLVSTSQEVGGAIGVAAIATIAAGHTNGILAAAAQHVPTPSALVAGFRWGFLAGAGVAALGIVVARLMIRAVPLGGDGREPPAAAEPRSQGGEGISMKILVPGANGDVGQRIVTDALNRGHEVTAGMRHPETGGTPDIRSAQADEKSGEAREVP
jgi:EmrB/QacA subfamily drug resistance transporter